MSEMMTRKEFLARGVQAVIAVAGLTACGQLLSTNVFAQTKPDEITVGPDKSLLTVDELKQRGAVNFVVNGKKAILLYNGGEIRAFENICTHRGGPNHLSGDKLVCKWHGATFNPLTGESTKPPAPSGSKLPAVKLEIKDGKIFLA